VGHEALPPAIVDLRVAHPLSVVVCVGPWSPEWRASEQDDPHVVGCRAVVEGVGDVVGEVALAEGIGAPRSRLFQQEPAAHHRSRRQQRLVVSE
jgi:hypothetical protein